MSRVRYDPTSSPPIVRSVAWDPARPLLAGIRARMEDLLSPAVLVREDEVVFWYDFRSHPNGTHKDGTPRVKAKATRHETETFSLQALLDEQVGDGEALLIALQGDSSGHTFNVVSRIPDHRVGDPGPVYDPPREVEMRVGIKWGAPRQAGIMMPPVASPRRSRTHQEVVAAHDAALVPGRRT